MAAADLDGGGGHGDRGVDVRPGHREEDGGERGDGEARHQPAVRLAGHLQPQPISAQYCGVRLHQWEASITWPLSALVAAIRLTSSE